MALSGIHIVCTAVTAGHSLGSLPVGASWSETQSSPGTTTNSLSVSTGSLIRVRASQDCYVAIAKVPDATNGPRFFVAAATDYDFYGNPGDKVAWALA